MDKTDPVFSIVAPVHNEEGNLHRLYERIVAVMDALGEPWELLLINDGSRDGSLDEMLQLHKRDSRVRIISFARNFGHQTAVTAGMDFSGGKAVILIDADLQDPPELIQQMVEKWREGFHVVYAVRAERKGESRFKLWTARLFYRLTNRITNIDIPLDTGDFRLMDRRVVNAVMRMREHNRFIRGMTSWVGFRQTGVEYVRQPREIGETKYNLSKMLRLALDGITGFSYFPLQVAIYISFILAVLAVLALPVIVVLRLATEEVVLEGQATTLSVLLILSAFQFLFFFILGQYIARIYDEVRARPLYVIADTYGVPFDTENVPPRVVAVPEDLAAPSTFSSVQEEMDDQSQC
ncbi:MAG: glycosyltransferase family 2 protein [Chloroflexi bacterium]|nr:glycosyltransferase family 2 protein [Chloroflexota bacterium]